MHVMTSYEACEIVSLRAILLSQGAPTLLSEQERAGQMDHPLIALRELQLGRLDVQVHRPEEVINAQDMRLPRNACAQGATLPPQSVGSLPAPERQSDAR